MFDDYFLGAGVIKFEATGIFSTAEEPLYI